MSRKNDYEGDMGRKYREVMAVICPHEKVGYDLIREKIDQTRAFNILDLGCGGGEFLVDLEQHPLWIAQYHHLRLTGVDKSAVMIEKANRLVGSRTDDVFRLVESDLVAYLTAMNLVGQKAQIITSNFVFHNFTREEREGIFPLLCGALPEGGLFYSLDKIAVDDPLRHDKMYNAQLAVVDSLARHGLPEFVQPWREHYAMDNAPERRMTEGDLHEALRRAGFKKSKTLYRGKLEAVVEATK